MWWEGWARRGRRAGQRKERVGSFLSRPSLILAPPFHPLFSLVLLLLDLASFFENVERFYLFLFSPWKAVFFLGAFLTSSLASSFSSFTYRLTSSYLTWSVCSAACLSPFSFLLSLLKKYVRSFTSTKRVFLCLVSFFLLFSLLFLQSPSSAVSSHPPPSPSSSSSSCLHFFLSFLLSVFTSSLLSFEIHNRQPFFSHPYSIISPRKKKGEKERRRNQNDSSHQHTHTALSSRRTEEFCSCLSFESCQEKRKGNSLFFSS